jgi:hypothetical protein
VPVKVGPITVDVGASYYSSTAFQLVVMIEMSTTAKVTPVAFPAVYVAASGQQVEASESIAPSDLFPGAAALLVFMFPAASPGGTVNWTAYDNSFNNLELSLSVPS